MPLWYSGAGQYESATDLNHVRRAVRMIDAWTYRNEPALDSSTGLDTNTPGYYDNSDPLRIWWGAALFRTGVTSITIEGYARQYGSEVFKVWVGGGETSRSGTLAGTITPPATLTTFSSTFSISGFTDGQVVSIEITVEGTRPGNENYQISDVYLSPVTKSGWVAPPAFSAVADATNAAKLTQLCDAAQWLYERVRLVPVIPRLAMYYNLGPFKDPSFGDAQHTNRPLYYGSVGRYYANSDLHIYGAVNSPTAAGWNYLVYLNSVLAYTSPTYGTGATLIDQRFSLNSYTLGSRVRVALLASVSDGGTADPSRFTRWTIGKIHAVAQTSGWPYATLPAAFPNPSTSTINADTLRARLASLSTILTNAKTRIDARPEQWARSRAHRRHYTRNGGVGEGLLQARARPYFWQRTGNELIVQGKDVKLCYGPITTTPDAQSSGWENYTFQREEDIADAENGTTVYLDDYEGLDMGARFALKGNVTYAAEIIG